ncbi:MAG: hypothetical protein ABJA76_18120, partial [Mucilaginibacter sp.]
MTKREQYELIFFKSKSPRWGNPINCCKKGGAVNQFSHLQFIQRLTNKTELNGLISDLEDALRGEYYEQYFCTDATEDLDIELNFPNVILGEKNLIIPMLDLRDLLIEWR